MDFNQSPSEWLGKYLRFTNYLGAAQLFLRDNFLLEEELTPDHIKRRVLGHWGTVPGLNFIWAVLDYVIKKYEQEMLLVIGPGHGYPAAQSNLFLEGSLAEFFKEYDPYNPDLEMRKSAYAKLIKNFSWPGGFPSHLNPYTPGCILEGGELGYALATSYGAAFDNPDLIVPCIVGDGEAETGPTATAWHSNKFLNPITSGAVLPIVHINGYKISGPTLYGTMSNDELMHLFKGYGYEPVIVEGDFLFEPMIAAVESSYQKIKQIQNEARSSGKAGQPKWPVILLRSQKGWFGPKPKSDSLPIIDSFRSHGTPLGNASKDIEEFKLVKEWLESYNIRELINDDYSLKAEVLEYVPSGDLRMGMNKQARAVGTRDLVLPDIEQFQVDIGQKGSMEWSSTAKLADYMKDIFILNEKQSNFRLFCPDETESNKLQVLFDVTKRGYLWPTRPLNDENLAPDGRVMEMLSEHTLEGWYQGYTLTGRHGIFVSYEAFLEIISSMVDQYIKFMKHARHITWRRPVPSLNFLVTSLGWRQEHNGFSHQNPGFISSMLNNYGDFVSVYYPVDANSMLAVGEEVFKSRNKVNLIVAGKRPIQQWLTLDEARVQIKEDVKIWKFVSDEDPDVVMVGVGDYLMRELIAARLLLKRLLPEIRIRIVNVTEISSFGIGDNKCPTRVSPDRFNEVFTTDRPIIFNYHGYPEDIKTLVFNHSAASRMSIHGYHEVGTTTTPFDMLVQNKTDRFSIAIEALQYASLFNPKVKEQLSAVDTELKRMLSKHKHFVEENGFDMDEVKEFSFV